MRKLILFVFFSISLVSICSSQTPDIAAVYIQGDVKVMHEHEKESAAKSLVHGAVGLKQKLILGKYAKVKLVKKEGAYSELEGPGTFLVSDLIFTPNSDNSLLSQLGDYFLSFFISNTSSESKSNYTNSIYAISRGDEDAAVLEYPFQGLLSVDGNKLDFAWTHKCTDCGFKISLKDFETKTEIYSSTVSGLHYTLQSPSKYLKAGRKYYWTITSIKPEVVSIASSFTIAAKGEYQSIVKNVEKTIKKEKIHFQSASNTLLVMCALKEQQMANFAMQYANDQIRKDPKDALLKEFTQRFYYAQLLSKL